MNLTGAPAHCWLLCMLYVCHLLNATASAALGGLTPLPALTGQVPDISDFLHFSSWEPIYYKVDESEPDHRFPSQSNEKRGHRVGFAENKGDQLTWTILTDDTNTSSSDLLSGVPPRLHQTSGWTHHKGRINHKISHLMCLFMVGPILMDLTTHHPCSSLILMTDW